MNWLDFGTNGKRISWTTRRIRKIIIVCRFKGNFISSTIN